MMTPEEIAEALENVEALAIQGADIVILRYKPKAHSPTELANLKTFCDLQTHKTKAHWVMLPSDIKVEGLRTAALGPLADTLESIAKNLEKLANPPRKVGLAGAWGGPGLQSREPVVSTGAIDIDENFRGHH